MTRDIVKPCHRNRTPYRVVIQYRENHGGVRGIRAAFHYGRGVPIRYTWLPGHVDRVDAVADMIREADNGIAPDAIVTAPPHRLY